MQPWSRKSRSGGNSQGLRLSKALLSDVEIDVGDAVNVAVRDGALVGDALCAGCAAAHDLSELVKRIPKNYEPEELDWGPPVGREVW